MFNSLEIASSGMAANSERLKVIAQNIANANSTATTPGGAPYQRKTIAFKTVLDKELGASKVVVDKVGVDTAPFEQKYEPGNPMANKDGYIQLPNVSTIIEMTDMREARNSYQANLSVIEVTKSMISRTLDLLRI